MKMRNLTNEDLLYILAFVLALGVRLLDLGGVPLSESEAGLALQAFDLARGDLAAAATAPQPGYLALTSATFALLGSSELLARLWPALVGGFTVLAPFAFRPLLGRKAALIMAFGLALDPGLVALSRLADGRMMAIGFAVIALALAYARKPAGAGICTGLALLSGPSIWLGLLGMVIAWGGVRLVGLPWGLGELEGGRSATPPASASPGFRRTWVGFTFGTILIVGTMFFSFPAGLGAWASSLSTFARGWVQPSGIPAGRLLVALAFYQPLALIFGIVAVVRDWRRDRSLVWSLGLWVLAALVLSAAFPGRGVGDLAWVIVPLLALTAVGLSAYLGEGLKNPISITQAAALVVLLALVWLTLAGLHLTVVEAIRLRLWLVLGIFMLAILTTVFVALGWSREIALNGAVMGVSLTLAVYTISAMLGASQVHAENPAELWQPPPRTGQAALLGDTLRELSLSHTGDAHALEVVSIVDSPALRWVLRDYSEARFPPSLDEDLLPAVVVAPLGSETRAWSAAYRGQDFAWRLNPGWEGVLPEAWVDWLVFREAPVQTEYILLWARSDLFPEEAVTGDESVEGLEEESDEVE